MGNRPVSAASLREWLKQDADSSHREDQDIVRNWQSGELPAERAAVVTPFMHAHSFPAAMGVARHGDFANVHRLLDVGGGSGCFCIALATRYPGMRMAVMELPPVCHLVEQYVARYGLQGQIEAVAANMFTDP
jgi:methylase of polypeptide subunit release factors